VEAQTKFVKTFYLTYGHCGRIRYNVWSGLYFIYIYMVIICCFFFYWLHNCSWESLVIDCRSSFHVRVRLFLPSRYDYLHVQRHGGVCHFFLLFLISASLTGAFLLVLLRLYRFFIFFLAYIQWNFCFSSHFRATELHIFFFFLFLVSSGMKANMRRLIRKRPLRSCCRRKFDWTFFFYIYFWGQNYVLSPVPTRHVQYLFQLRLVLSAF